MLTAATSLLQVCRPTKAVQMAGWSRLGWRPGGPWSPAPSPPRPQAGVQSHLSWETASPQAGGGKSKRGAANGMSLGGDFPRTVTSSSSKVSLSERPPALAGVKEAGDGHPRLPHVLLPSPPVRGTRDRDTVQKRRRLGLPQTS